MFVHYLKTLLFLLAATLGRYSCHRVNQDWHPPTRIDQHFVQQQSDTDCGVAAATTLLRLNGVLVGYADVSDALQPKRRGADMLAMSRAIRGFGIALKGVRFASRDLNTTPALHPWIALLGSAASGHYVVVADITADTVRVYDPKLGVRQMKRSGFEGLWTGYGLVPDRDYRVVEPHDQSNAIISESPTGSYPSF